MINTQLKLSFVLVIALLWVQALSATAAFAAPRIEYTVSMDEPHTHYYTVQMRVSGHKQAHIDFKMPVWTPGSYLIREYPKHVEAFSAVAGNGQPLASEKISKNTWRVYSRSADQVTVQYRVYAFEISVRTSFLDASHGYIQPAATFMYVEKLMNNPATLTVKPYKDWKQVSTGLSPAGNDPFVFNVPNFDILVDSPIEVGNQKVLEFSALGKPHYVAMYGEGNYEEERLLRDMKRIVEESAKIFNNELPYDKYVFIVHNLHGGGGGLEHMNSTTLQTSRNGYGTESGYNGFLGLVAHEYFHLWNVKRIRPAALGPFDYERENYTTLLWVAEGFTSYYDKLLLRRANLTGPEQYLSSLGSTINTVENTPGNEVQSVAEASFDAWIKYYQPNENSGNTTISYYTKGSLLAMLLDLEIRNSSGGQRSLDDVMRYLYTDIYKKQNRGYTEKELQQAVEKAAGKSLDTFFKAHVYGTQPIEYNQFLNGAGLRLIKTKAGGGRPYLGVAASVKDGRLTITGLRRNSSGYDYGLNVNDEIISVDQNRVTSLDELNRYVENKAIGDTVQFMVVRAGTMHPVEVKLGESPNHIFRLEAVNNPAQNQVSLLQNWLSI
jgi:predicted metalloprotease with PDZ domain